MTTTLRTVSGRTREVPAHVDQDTIVGLDSEGRIVVKEDWMSGAGFGLTLCCAAFDKGTESGIVCRACYGEYSDDAGSYPFESEIDPVLMLTTR